MGSNITGSRKRSGLTGVFHGRPHHQEGHGDADGYKDLDQLGHPGVCPVMFINNLHGLAGRVTGECGCQKWRNEKEEGRFCTPKFIKTEIHSPTVRLNSNSVLLNMNIFLLSINFGGWYLHCGMWQFFFFLYIYIFSPVSFSTESINPNTDMLLKSIIALYFIWMGPAGQFHCTILSVCQPDTAANCYMHPLPGQEVVSATFRVTERISWSHTGWLSPTASDFTTNISPTLHAAV